MNPGGQLLRFIATGFTSMAVDLAALHVLLRSGMEPFIAVAVAFLIGVTVNLLMHKYFTFRDPAPLHGAQVARFLCVVAINLAITEAIVWWATSAGYDALVGKVLSLPPVLGVGFTLSRLWVFRVST
ncbi:MAG: GtrA family protein [Burkholderiales bacterium]|nr:GtrA family protein [Burkholderiales bacterium]